MAETRTILILGAGVMQLPAIRAAHRIGLRTVVADANKDAPGVTEADTFEHVDLRDTDGMIEMARRYHEAGELHGVFTAGTDFSSTVARVADVLGLPGTSVQSANNATDKFRMRQVLKDAGVPVPGFTVIEAAELSARSVRDAVSRIGLPAVVKPADSMGARGVVKVETAEQAIQEAESSLAHSASGRVVIEGYIDGPEFSLDAIVYGGAVQVTGFADRHIRFPPHFIEVGHTIPSAVSREEMDQVTDVFTRGVTALGITNGAAKGDMKLSTAGPVIGEIAARLSGGFMSGWTYPLSTGVELTERAIRVALGEAPGSLEPRWHRTSAERAVISIPGIVAELRGVDAVKSQEAIGAVFVSVEPGREVRFPRNNVEKCANVISVADEQADAVRAAEHGVASIEVVLRHGVRQTNEFLFGPAPPHWAYDPRQLDREWLNRALPGRSPQTVVGLGREAGPALTPEVVLPAAVGGLPPQAHLRDWAWRSLGDTLAVLQREGLVDTDRFDPEIGPVVWQAILRGGLQGGRYLLSARR